jgi:hypothetical protein
MPDLSPTELLPYLQRRPFEPFRIGTSEGRTYDIRHPEMVMVLPTAVLIGYPNLDFPGAYLRYDVVSMFHIIRLELMPATVQGNGNP